MDPIVRFVDGRARRKLHRATLGALTGLAALLATPAAMRAQSHGDLQVTASVVDARASERAARGALALVEVSWAGALPALSALADGTRLTVERPRDPAGATVVRIEFVQ